MIWKDYLHGWQQSYVSRINWRKLTMARFEKQKTRRIVMGCECQGIDNLGAAPASWFESQSRDCRFTNDQEGVDSCFSAFDFESNTNAPFGFLWYVEKCLFFTQVMYIHSFNRSALWYANWHARSICNVHGIIDEHRFASTTPRIQVKRRREDEVYRNANNKGMWRKDLRCTCGNWHAK